MKERGRLSLRGIRAVLAVLDEGSISRAAPALFISQPALSRLVKLTEERLGVRLFDRHAEGVVANSQAGHVFDRFRRVRDQLDLVSDELSLIPEMKGVNIPLYRHLALRHLRSVVMTFEHGSATAAAAGLGQSKTAVARAIRDVEALLGMPLFERRPGGLVPTRLGRTLIRHAKIVLHELRYVREEVMARSGSITGHVAIGSMPLARSQLVPEAVSRFARANPDLRFSIVEGPYNTLLDGLQCGDLDLVVGALREPAPAKSVREEELFQAPLSLVVRRGHPLCGQELGYADLTRFTWILPPKGTPARSYFSQVFADAGLPAPSEIVECSSLIATRALLLRNDWIAITTRQQIYYEEQFGILEALPLSLPGTSRAIGITVRTDTAPPPAAAAFISTLRVVSKEIVGAAEVEAVPST